MLPVFPTTTLIPLEPKLGFCVSVENVVERGIIMKNNVMNINRHLRTNSEDYYFANDLRLCF